MATNCINYFVNFFNLAIIFISVKNYIVKRSFPILSSLLRFDVFDEYHNIIKTKCLLITFKDNKSRKIFITLTFQALL